MLVKAEGVIDVVLDPRRVVESNETEREVELHQEFQDRTLCAVHALEAALAAAAPGRERSWRDTVLGALRELDDSLSIEDANANRPDSLLADISRLHPRLRSRVHGLRAQYQHIREDIGSLRRTVEVAAKHDRLPDYDHLRHRLAWLLTALRHLRARESDLVYEAYYQTYNVDLDAERAPSHRSGEALAF